MHPVLQSRAALDVSRRLKARARAERSGRQARAETDSPTAFRAGLPSQTARSCTGPLPPPSPPYRPRIACRGHGRRRNDRRPRQAYPNDGRMSDAVSLSRPSSSSPAWRKDEVWPTGRSGRQASEPCAEHRAPLTCVRQPGLCHRRPRRQFAALRAVRRQGRSPNMTRAEYGVSSPQNSIAPGNSCRRKP